MASNWKAWIVKHFTCFAVSLHCLFGARPAMSQAGHEQPTRVVGTIVGFDGIPESGVLLISWPSFATSMAFISLVLIEESPYRQYLDWAAKAIEELAHHPKLQE
jgi:hypothetical protein